jgi:hypothetical protein
VKQLLLELDPVSAALARWPRQRTLYPAVWRVAEVRDGRVHVIVEIHADKFGREPLESCPVKVSVRRWVLDRENKRWGNGTIAGHPYWFKHRLIAFGKDWTAAVAYADRLADCCLVPTPQTETRRFSLSPP